MDIKDLALSIAIDKNAKPYTNQVFHGTPFRGNIYAYDPSFAYTGEGANVYGVSHYSIDNPVVAEYYAGMKDNVGQVLYEYLPDESEYINPDKPLSQQSKKVQDFLKNRILDDKMALKEAIIYNKLPNDYLEYLYDGKNVMRLDEMYERYKQKPIPVDGIFPAEYRPSSQSPKEYKKALELAKEVGAPGIVRYKEALGDALPPVKVFQTISPQDVEIRNVLEPEQRKYAKYADVKKDYDAAIKAFNTAKQYQNKLNTGTAYLKNIATNIMSNPVVKVGGKVMGTLGTLSSLAGGVEGASGTGRGIMPTLGGLFGGTETAKLLKQGVNPRVMTQMNYESFNLNTPEDWEAYREALKRVPVNYNR